jgi:hypothetical protein
VKAHLVVETLFAKYKQKGRRKISGKLGFNPGKEDLERSDHVWIASANAK